MSKTLIDEQAEILLLLAVGRPSGSQAKLEQENVAADMPSKQLINCAVRDRRLCEKLSKADVLIWDEASMSSAKMIELANTLHHHLSSEESGLENLPFAGKQVIIVGEFLIKSLESKYLET